MSTNAPAVEAKVYLRNRDYLPDFIVHTITTFNPQQRFVDSTITDDSGTFSFNTIRHGDYIIEGFSNDSEYSVFIDSICIDNISSRDYHVDGTLKKPTSSISGTINLPDTTTKTYAFILGTNRYTVINSDGTYRLDGLPEGRYQLSILPENKGCVAGNTLPVALEPNTAVHLPVLYRITYQPRGNTSGTVPIDGKLYMVGEHTTVLGNIGNLQKAGATFSGWNKDETGKGKAYLPGDTLLLSSTNSTLYAQWQLKRYYITYDLNGGTNSDNPESYTVETPTITFSEATRIGYVFDGWFSDIGLTIRTISLPYGSTGFRWLWAKWVLKDVDGNIYTEEKVGIQIWMTENLRTTKLNDGTPLQVITNIATWITCSTPGLYIATDSNDIFYNSYLYNWYAVNSGKLAPVGWHIPDNDEWDTLSNSSQTMKLNKKTAIDHEQITSDYSSTEKLSSSLPVWPAGLQPLYPSGKGMIDSTCNYYFLVRCIRNY